MVLSAATRLSFCNNIEWLILSKAFDSSNSIRVDSLKIYADDFKIYRTINEPDKDISALQLDLHRLNHWAKKLQLRFNPEKCKVMRATHSRDGSKPSYSLGVQLKSVESVKLE